MCVWESKGLEGSICMHRLSVTGNQLNIFIADYSTVWELHTHTFIMVTSKSCVAIYIDRVMYVKYHAFHRQCFNSFAIMHPNSIAGRHMKGLNPWGFQLQMQCDSNKCSLDMQPKQLSCIQTKFVLCLPDFTSGVFGHRLTTTMLILHYHSLSHCSNLLLPDYEFIH